jgi:hypothetical protein
MFDAFPASQLDLCTVVIAVLVAPPLPLPLCHNNNVFRMLLQDDVFQNTYGFGRDSAKADKELGDFKNMFFNADASAAAAPMEVRGGGGRCRSLQAAGAVGRRVGSV